MGFNQTNYSNKDYALIHRDKKNNNKKKRSGQFPPRVTQSREGEHETISEDWNFWWKAGVCLYTIANYCRCTMMPA